MRITVKGQVTIPQHVRRFLGVSAYSEVDFTIRGGEVLLTRAGEAPDAAAGSRFRKLRGIKRGTMSTEKWMAATREG